MSYSEISIKKKAPQLFDKQLGAVLLSNRWILFDAYEEEKWLWSTYTHPKAIEEPFYLWSQEASYIKVKIGDFVQLKEVSGYIMKKRGLVPAVKG
jgi:hypothetical protein